MNVTIQIQIESDNAIEESKLLEIDGEMGTCCHRLEKITRDYIRCQMFVDEKVYIPK